MKPSEFLHELKETFGPNYRPSPGGVYPAVGALEREGLLKATLDGRAKRYSLTAAGRTALEKRRGQLAAVEERTGSRLDDHGSLRPVLERFVARVMKNSGRLAPEIVADRLDELASELESL